MKKEKDFEYFIKKNIVKKSYDIYVRFCNGDERLLASFYVHLGFNEPNSPMLHAEQYAKSQAYRCGVYLGHL